LLAFREEAGFLTAASLPARLAAKIVETPGPMATPCWRWTGATDSSGYGNVKVQGRVRKAHRVVYELLCGPLPAGMEGDHLCRERACVRPEHIEPVTHIENAQRGDGSWMPGERQRTMSAPMVEVWRTPK
jgi:hypothetical protein